jgi:signal transduction histidine kinase
MPDRTITIRGIQLAAVAAAMVLSASTILTPATAAGPGQIALDLIVGLVFVACGTTAWNFRRTNPVGPLMIVTGLAWLVAGVLHRGPIIHLLLAFPTGRLTGRLATGVVAFAYLDGVVESFSTIELATIALAVGVVAAAALGLMSSGGPIRRRRTWPTVAGVCLACALAAGPITSFIGIEAAATRLLLYEVLLLAIAIGLTAELLRVGGAAAVTGLVVELGSRAEAGTLRDRLARALGDPSLVVGYFVRESGTYVDDAGAAIDLPDAHASRVATLISHEGGPQAILVHDAAVLGDRALVESVAAAARVAVRNAELQAEIQDRVVALEASQRRILQAADVQRSRIEGELNLGAMTRLNRVRDILERLPSGSDASVDKDLAAATGELRRADDELRRFARGVYPASLAEGGLPSAVTDLAARSVVDIALDIAVDRLPSTVETTAYFVCSETLANVAKHAEASRAEIVASVSDGVLHLVLSDNGIGGADVAGSGIQGLIGRVEALGGRLRIISPPGQGTRIDVELPVR